MFKQLLIKEIRLLFQSKQFVWVSSILLLLMLMSFSAGVQNYKNAQAQYESGIQQHKQKLEQANYWMSIEQEVFLPPQTLSVFINGLSNDAGRKIAVTRTNELFAQDSRYSDNPILAIFRTLDLEFMLTVLLPLFALVFTYSAINGERENGTLSLLFSNSVSRSTFILSKVSGTSIALITPVLIAFLLCLLLLPFIGIPFQQADYIRIVLLFVAGIGHLLIYTFIGLGVSAVVRSSSSSFMIVLVIWILSVFILPRASVLIAGRSVEVPNRDAIIAQKNRYRMQLFDEDRPKLSQFKPTNSKDAQATMAEFQKMMSTMSEERAKKVNELASKLDEEYQNKRIYRDNLALSFSQISPTAVFQLILNKTSQTGINLSESFYEQAKDYKTTFENFIQEKTGTKATGMIMIFETDEERPKLDISEIPEFTFKMPSISETVKNLQHQIILLLMYIATSFFWAFYGFIQSDIK